MSHNHRGKCVCKYRYQENMTKKIKEDKNHYMGRLGKLSLCFIFFP